MAKSSRTSRMRQRRGRLVEDEHAWRGRHALDDLDELALGDAQMIDLGRRIDGDAAIGKGAVAPPPRAGRAADEARQNRARLAAEEDVLGDRQLGKQAQLLVDEHDARGAACAGVVMSAGSPAIAIVPS